MRETERRRAAGELKTAAKTRRPIPPLSARLPGLDARDAYAIQLANVGERLAAGAIVRGHKVGLTSKAMQEMLGVYEPDYGHILDDMLVPAGGTVSIGRFLQPRVEIEIAFLLGRPLAGEAVAVADVLAATAAVAPAIEIIDSRIADWRITLVDTIADNASAGAVVVGPWVPLARAPSLPGIEAELFINGSTVASGSGAAVLGDPAEAVAWLARTLTALGSRLEASHVVMPGSCTKAVDVRAGDRVEGRFAGLGSVSVAFSS
ncbi:MAG TPA: 2-keto-4-pentenoate hydratase [Deltaproteobacteria bacterium]|nr:2-keto-4-pentenoate hydratase [Deltaproteobacteria bacterium]